MRKLLFLFVLLMSQQVFSQEVDSLAIQIAQIENSLEYETGTIELPAGNAKIKVPTGFRFLDKDQSQFVFADLWGNPPDSSIIGMLVPEGRGVLEDSSWVFTISFDEMGYVNDEDAEDIDYDDLLKEQQEEMKKANPSRVEMGYPSIEFIGWASSPYYDKEKKILHWAKELKFGEDEMNTLNYNLRVLGRKGLFVINAIASMREMNEVKASINKVISSVEFNEGSRYADFDPDIDEVAAWTIGGLVAGKILAKVGFFAILLKFWKVAALAIAGAGGAAWRYIKGKGEKNA